MKSSPATARATRDAAGSVADRLMAALVAGDCVGGDHRGRLAAGIRVAKRGVDGYWLELLHGPKQRRRGGSAAEVRRAEARRQRRPGAAVSCRSGVLPDGQRVKHRTRQRRGGSQAFNRVRPVAKPHDEDKLGAYLDRLQHTASSKPLVLGEYGIDSLRHGDRSRILRLLRVLRGSLRVTGLESGPSGPVLSFQMQTEVIPNGRKRLPRHHWSMGLRERSDEMPDYASCVTHDA